MKALLRLLLAATAVLLASCSKTPSWLRGKFELDQQRTSAEIQAIKSKGEQPSLLGALLDIGKALAPIAVAQKFDGSTITVTDVEMVITKNGTGTVEPFTVHEQQGESIMLKTASNEVQTWIKTDSGIALKAAKGLPFTVHFKRVP
jgi:hypothetical protein